VLAVSAAVDDGKNDLVGRTSFNIDQLITSRNCLYKQYNV
jgi:hypothetical protein